VRRLTSQSSWGHWPPKKSASEEDADIAAAYPVGVNAFFANPPKASKLEDMAKAIKYFWLTHNTLPQDSHAGAPAPGLVHARMTAVAAKPPQPVTRASRRKWKYEKATK